MLLSHSQELESIAVAESLIRDLRRVSECCDLWEMKVNACKTNTMILSKSRMMHSQSPPFTINGTLLNETDDLDIFCVTFDSKMTIEKHHRSVFREAAQSFSVLKKSL